MVWIIKEEGGELQAGCWCGQVRGSRASLFKFSSARFAFEENGELAVQGRQSFSIQIPICLSLFLSTLFFFHPIKRLNFELRRPSPLFFLSSSFLFLLPSLPTKLSFFLSSSLLFQQNKTQSKCILYGNKIRKKIIP